VGRKISSVQNFVPDGTIECDLEISTHIKSLTGLTKNGILKSSFNQIKKVENYKL
jgi:hypothetical protein